MVLIGIFAGLAVVLASIGLYGVIAYLVSQRLHEFGLRMALGAQSRDIFRLVLVQGLKLAGVGVGFGLVASFVFSRLLQSFLFEVNAVDPLTYGGVSVLLIGITLFACCVPAFRATRVDPMVALRYE
jgi:putative ABC transport system permease protein